MWRAGLLIALWMALTGCQTTHEQLLAQGYPPAFADGFSDGCSSGRQAAGFMTGAFKKDVPRYLKDANYAEGWSDGFRQCEAMRESQERDEYQARHWDQRERDWQHEKDQDAARAYRSN